jgi:hypothetical protein
LPALQVIIRQLVRLAAKGTGSAQRLVLELIRTIEQEEAIRAQSKAGATVHFHITRAF